MRIRWAPIAISTAFAIGAAVAAIVGLWEPGWGVAAAFPLLTAALAAGVVRDPEGPEVHVFLGASMALAAGFLAVTIAFTTSELERLSSRAREGRSAALVEEHVARIRGESWPKWVLIGASLPIGGVALAVRHRARARSGAAAGGSRRAPPRAN